MITWKIRRPTPRYYHNKSPRSNGITMNLVPVPAVLPWSWPPSSRCYRELSPLPRSNRGYCKKTVIPIPMQLSTWKADNTRWMSFTAQPAAGLRLVRPEYWGFSSDAWGYLTKQTRSSAIAEGPRDASCQLKSCQLPHNSAETTCTTCPKQIEVMKWRLCWADV